jgi:hypothetical protein
MFPIWCHSEFLPLTTCNPEKKICRTLSINKPKLFFMPSCTTNGQDMATLEKMVLTQISELA